MFLSIGVEPATGLERTDGLDRPDGDGLDARDLGYLLHKHPDRVHVAELPVGTATVFFPQADAERCTVALQVEVDPIALIRSKRSQPNAFTLGQYVNDRPYAASSLLAVALGRVFRTALAGRCTARPELVEVALPLRVEVSALPGSAALVERLFGPLGWQVDARALPLDPRIAAWGDARYVDLTLTGLMSLSSALSHLYVLLPVLDDAKHYWVGPDEIDKLIRTAGGWLAAHPDRELVMRRYLAHQREYVADAVDRLTELDDAVQPADSAVEPSNEVSGGSSGSPSGEIAETVRPLARDRRDAVLAELHRLGARRVVDLGCGDGVLLAALLADPAFTEVLGADVSARELDRAQRRLRLDRLADAQRARISLVQSSLTYRDARLVGYDAAVLMEVIEHVDPPRLPDLVACVFGEARPRAVLVTTPNIEFNVRYPRLVEGGLRHPDHRFEWTRAEFAAWTDQVAEERGYRVRREPVGPVDPEVGPATQLAVFERTGSADS